MTEYDHEDDECDSKKVSRSGDHHTERTSHTHTECFAGYGSFLQCGITDDELTASVNVPESKGSSWKQTEDLERSETTQDPQDPPFGVSIKATVSKARKYDMMIRLSC